MIITDKTAKTLGISSQDISILKSLKKGLTVSAISDTTKIPRTSLYYMLEKLKDRGFIYKSHINDQITWFMNPDDKFLKIYNKAIHNIVPIKKEEDGGRSNNVKVCIGANNILKIFNDILSLPKKSRVCCIEPEASFITAIKKNLVKDLFSVNESLKKREVIMEGIVHEGAIQKVRKVLMDKDLTKYLESFGDRSADTVKLPESMLLETKSEIYLYNNKMVIINWDKEFGVAIEDRDTYDLLMSMFKSTKHFLGKYNQNERIKQMLEQ